MIKYETINGKLCRMVEPTPLQPDSPMPCIARIVQDDTAMGKYNRSRCCAEALVKKHLITDVSYGGFVLIESGKVYASECWQYEIIGYPVEEGSHWWALWQAENGKSFEHKTAHHCRIFTMFSETELRVTNEEGEVVEFVDIDRFLSEGAKDGWQLYEPEPEPPKEPKYKICTRCGGSQSVPNPVFSITAYTTCPKCGGTGYEIDKRKKEPEKESPVDPIERPLRSLILRAKEEGKNIRTYYQDMVFTPCALDGLLADGKFRWWNISNWKLTNREQNYYPQPYGIDEPNPEPSFAVGDWVTDGVVIGYVSSILSQHTLIVTATDGKLYSMTTSILIRFDPSEVVIHIGCLSGTVAPGCSDATIMIVPIGYNGFGDVAIIPVAMLDATTRELVESLLKAQEEK